MDIGDIKYLQEPVKVLKPSEAIRIGSKLRMQGFGLLCAPSGETCAIGALMHARGWEPKYGDTDSVINKFLSDIPGEMGTVGSLFHEIGTRNDAGWTREAIADWLETQGY